MISSDPLIDFIYYNTYKIILGNSNVFLYLINNLFNHLKEPSIIVIKIIENFNLDF